MKTRSIGVLGAATFATAASMFVASGANADLIGLMATQRTVTGGALINVFAVVNNGADVILSVSGGQTGSIRSAGLTGGFLQGAGTQSVWKPTTNQNWTTLDSFLTVGGGFNTTNNSWTGNAGTTGDPNWNVDFDGTPTDAFSTPSEDGGFQNPWTNSCPPAGGYFLVGASSPARSLASIATANRFAATSAAAQNGAFGFMIAQFYVSSVIDTASEVINFDNMRVFIRAGGTTAQDASFGVFSITVPAPGAVALLGLAGLAGRRRRA